MIPFLVCPECYSTEVSIGVSNYHTLVSVNCKECKMPHCIPGDKLGEYTVGYLDMEGSLSRWSDEERASFFNKIKENQEKFGRLRDAKKEKI